MARMPAWRYIVLLERAVLPVVTGAVERYVSVSSRDATLCRPKQQNRA